MMPATCHLFPACAQSDPTYNKIPRCQVSILSQIRMRPWLRSDDQLSDTLGPGRADTNIHRGSIELNVSGSQSLLSVCPFCGSSPQAVYWYRHCPVLISRPI